MSGDVHEPPTFFNAQRPLSVIKRGQTARGLVVVVPSSFHFSITSPTADMGNMKRVEMSLTDFLLMPKFEVTELP
jgi:hypothetical protein